MDRLEQLKELKKNLERHPDFLAILKNMISLMEEQEAEISRIKKELNLPLDGLTDSNVIYFFHRITLFDLIKDMSEKADSKGDDVLDAEVKFIQEDESSDIELQLSISMNKSSFFKKSESFPPIKIIGKGNYKNKEEFTIDSLHTPHNFPQYLYFYLFH